MTTLKPDDHICIPCGPSGGCNPLSPIDICPNEVDADVPEVVVENDDDDATGEEARIPRIRRDPLQPSIEERIHHEVIHLPFRSWCPDCVKAKAESNSHYKDKGKKERLLNGFHADYWFLRNENGDGQKQLTCLSIKEDTFKYHFGYVCNKKGRDGNLAKVVCKDVESIGLKGKHGYLQNGSG